MADQDSSSTDEQQAGAEQQGSGKPWYENDEELREDRGDIILEDQPLDPAALERIAKEGDDDDEDGNDEGDDDDKDEIDQQALQTEEEQPQRESRRGRPGYVPPERFNEVNAELKAEREARANLEARLAALEQSQQTTQQQATEQAPEVDLVALEEEASQAWMEGDIERSRELRSQVQTEILRRAAVQAEENAVRRIKGEQQAAQQAREQQEMAAAAADVVKRFPFLDSTSKSADADAIKKVVFLRNGYISEGMSPKDAMVQAANEIGALYLGPAASSDADGAGKDLRKRAALARAADESSTQPPRTSQIGAGQRSIPVTHVERMSEKEFKSLPEEERARLRGDIA